MAQPAAKANDRILGTDTHIVMVVAGPSLVPTPLPHVFSGTLDSGLVPTVKIGGQPAATVGSVAHNLTPHLPTPPGVSFQAPPSNQGTIIRGSATVTIGGKPAARHGDIAQTCNDPADMPVGSVIAPGMVLIGG
jgi:uncharacterized Zn-binding protein involved in type VI secretion